MTDQDKQKIRHMIDTISAYLAGSPIEVREHGWHADTDWMAIGAPKWNWARYTYRVREVEKLHLERRGEKLSIRYGAETLGKIIPGRVGRSCCHFLSSKSQVSARKSWRAGTRRVCPSPLEWCGRIYYLSESGTLISYYPGGPTLESTIYSFAECLAYDNCDDDNLDRFENKRIINY